jgi:hypothetical protein
MCFIKQGLTVTWFFQKVLDSKNGTFNIAILFLYSDWLNNKEKVD